MNARERAHNPRAVWGNSFRTASCSALTTGDCRAPAQVAEHEGVARHRQEMMWRRQNQRHSLRIRHAEREKFQIKLGASQVNSTYHSLLRSSASSGSIYQPAIFSPQTPTLSRSISRSSSSAGWLPLVRSPSSADA